MKVMIMAGGTGGHIFPAAAVAERLVNRGHQICWLGSSRGLEGRLVRALGYRFCALPVTAWRGGQLRKLLAPWNLLRALVTSLALFKREQPQVAVGFGGYAAAPGALGALLTRLPLVLHEQNGVPGLTNRWLADFATQVLQAFPGAFAGDYPVVGNPVRENLCQLPVPARRSLGQHAQLRILVLGGSQGAHAINELVPAAVAHLPVGEYELWHQSGAGKAEATLALYAQGQREARVVEFIDDMAAAYQWADLVIARAGASTVAEIAAVGLCSLLIPYPWHKDRQQYVNANWLVGADAAELLEQRELTPARLAAACHALNSNRALLQRRAVLAWQLGKRDAAAEIATLIEEAAL